MVLIQFKSGGDQMRILHNYASSAPGINIFLDGFVPTENLRFRETALTFKVAETALEEEVKRMCRYEYPLMVKKLGKDGVL